MTAFSNPWRWRRPRPGPNWRSGRRPWPRSAPPPARAGASWRGGAEARGGRHRDSTTDMVNRVLAGSGARNPSWTRNRTEVERRPCVELRDAVHADRPARPGGQRRAETERLRRPDAGRNARSRSGVTPSKARAPSKTWHRARRRGPGVHQGRVAFDPAAIDVVKAFIKRPSWENGNGRRRDARSARASP